MEGGPSLSLSLSLSLSGRKKLQTCIQRERKKKLQTPLFGLFLISIYHAYRQWSKRSFSDLWTWGTQRKEQSRTFSQPIALIHLNSLLRRAYTVPHMASVALDHIQVSNARWVQWGLSSRYQIFCKVTIV